MSSQLEMKKPTPSLVGAFDVLGGDGEESNSIYTIKQDLNQTLCFLILLSLALGYLRVKAVITNLPTIAAARQARPKAANLSK